MVIVRECSGGGAGQLEVSVDLLAHVLNNVQIKWEGLYAPICNMRLLAWDAY